MATAGATRIKGLAASYYMAKDLDRATKFYNELLAMTPTMEIPGVATEYTFDGGETFGLFKPPEDEWHEGHGMLFEVDDITGAVENCKSRGVRFEDDGKIEENQACFMAFADDSEGNRFMLHQHK